MKINKNTIIICLLIFIVIFITYLIVFSSRLSTYNILQNIMLGILSSFVVSIVVALVGYFHERNIIIEKIDNNIKSLYININVLVKMIGGTLQKIHSTKDLLKLSFNNISGLAKLNIDFINDMDLGLFSPIFKYGKMYEVYSSLLKFQFVLYNIKNIAMNLEIQSLEYSLIMEQNQQNGVLSNPNDVYNLDALKNTINIRTAKFHEYSTLQKYELEEIAKKFYEYKYKKQSWDDIKAELLVQIEGITKS